MPPLQPLPGPRRFTFVAGSPLWRLPPFPKLLPFHGAVPLLSPVAPPGMNLPCGLPLVFKMPSRCLHGLHYNPSWNPVLISWPPGEKNSSVIRGSNNCPSCFPSKSGFGVPPAPTHTWHFPYFSTRSLSRSPSLFIFHTLIRPRLWTCSLNKYFLKKWMDRWMKTSDCG